MKTASLAGALLFWLQAVSFSAAADLAGSEWRPTQLGDIEIPSDSGLFVQFGGDGKLQGHGGCNRFFASYSVTGDSIAIGPLGATRMACAKQIMERESLFLHALDAARHFRRDSIDLVLNDAGGNPVALLAQTDAD